MYDKASFSNLRRIFVLLNVKQKIVQPFRILKNSWRKLGLLFGIFNVAVYQLFGMAVDVRGMSSWKFCRSTRVEGVL